MSCSLFLEGKNRLRAEESVPSLALFVPEAMSVLAMSAVRRAVLLKIKVVWVITPCRLVNIYVWEVCGAFILRIKKSKQDQK
jgi:hypothetical protein